VGEAMSIGRTFKEALQKGLRSLEIKKYGLESIIFSKKDVTAPVIDNGMLLKIHQKLRVPCAERIFYIGDAFRVGLDVEKIQELTRIDPWFLHNIKEIIDLEKQIAHAKGKPDESLLRTAKEFGFSDLQLASLMDKNEEDIYQLRKSLNLKPSFKLVDTCAAEFRAFTPYFYSTYDR
jgi:carbamoyl-phosphate synthase large subunit